MSKALITLGKIRLTYYAGLIIDDEVIAVKSHQMPTNGLIDVNSFDWYRERAREYATDIKEAGITIPEGIQIADGKRLNDIDDPRINDTTMIDCDKLNGGRLEDFLGALQDSLGFRVR